MTAVAFAGGGWRPEATVCRDSGGGGWQQRYAVTAGAAVCTGGGRRRQYAVKAVVAVCAGGGQRPGIKRN